MTPTGVYQPIGHAHFGKAKGRMGGRIVGSLPLFISLLLRALLNPQKRKDFKKMPGKQDAMATLRALLESGKLTPIIARTFPLSEVRAAMRCMQEGHTLKEELSSLRKRRLHVERRQQRLAHTRRC